MIDPIIKALQERREKLGVSYRELSDQSGLAHPNVYNILNGKGNPTLDSIKRLAGAMGLDLRLVRKRRDLQRK